MSLIILGLVLGAMLGNAYVTHRVNTLYEKYGGQLIRGMERYVQTD